MEIAHIVIQIIIALGIINVWLIRFNIPSVWRGGSASNMRDEFEVYGLPGWMVWLVGFLKLFFAGALIAGIWYPQLTASSASGIAILMAGAISMHIRVHDSIRKSLPAFVMLGLSLFLIFS